MTKIRDESSDAIDEILGIARYVVEHLRKYSPNTIYDLQKYYRDTWKMIEGLQKKTCLFHY